MVGRTIGKYRIVGQIGRGGMGTVYKAVDETLDRFVAIKMLNADLVAEKSMERFRAEAMTVAKLNHPRIAMVYELTREADGLMMVMEYIAGETCEKLAAAGPLPIAQAVSICAQTLDALEHAHNAGIVHRDLKLSNLMLTASGDVKVMDFGIARVAGAEHLTQDGFMMGTPAYMAPEQVRGEEVDRRMDLYSMAVVLYKLLTGRLPHEGDTAFAVIHAQMNDHVRPAREFRPDLPAWLDDVLARGLAKSPAERFQSAAEFRAVLDSAGAASITMTQAFAQAETMGPTPTPVSVRMPVPLPPKPPASKSPAVTDTVTLRTPHLAAAGVLLALLVVAVAVLAFVALRRPVAVVSPGVTPQEAAATSQAPPPSAPVDPSLPPPSNVVVSAPAGPAPAAPIAAPVTTPGPTAAAPAAAAPKPAAKAPAVASLTVASGAPPKPATGAVAPSPATPPSAGARGTALPAGAPSSSAAAAASAKRTTTESFGDVRTLIVEGTRSREVDALLGLEPNALVVRNRRNGSIIGSQPYSSIAAATYSNSRRPRWKADATLATIPESIGGGGFFLSTSKHWLTLQTKSEFFILRLDDRNVQQVLTAIEGRTGVKVERPVDTDKQ